MGKDLKGKEIGEGIYQLASKKYYARVCGYGKRLTKTFSNLQEARLWVAERKVRVSPMMFSSEMSLNEWYEYWIENIKKPGVKYGTYEAYKNIYLNRIKDKLGNYPLSMIKPLECQALLNDELKRDKASTVKQTLICMQQIFKSAVDNELVEHSPITKTVNVKDNDKHERRIFTAEEQARFVEYLENHNLMYGDAWRLMLETGLRTGELLGLKWSDIDFDNKMITVNRSMYYVREQKRYMETTPKTVAGYRSIPMTNRAYQILKGIKVVGISYVFLDLDRSTRVNMSRPLYCVCDRLGIEHITVHGLRHSFATRCIECGMRPKTLQKILGHSTLAMTMDLYVHVTDESLVMEMRKLDFSRAI